MRPPASPWPLVALLTVGWAPALWAAEGGIAVALPEVGCPARGQVVAALEARLPGVTAVPGRVLELEGPQQAPVLRLRAAGGALEVERQLALDGRGPSPEGCEALAETAALVVARYLREIGYRPPAAAAVAAPPPASSVRDRPTAPEVVLLDSDGFGYLGVAGGARVAGGGATRGEVLIGAALHVRYLAIELASGVSSQTVVAVPSVPQPAALRLRSFPVRLALGVPFAVGGGTLVTTAGLSADVLTFAADGLVDARSGTRLEPAAELAVGYLLSRRLFGRVTLAGGVTLGGRDFDAGSAQPVFRTPSTYLRLQVEVGWQVWKNRRLGRL